MKYKNTIDTINKYTSIAMFSLIFTRLTEVGVVYHKPGHLTLANTKTYLAHFINYRIAK